MIDGIEMDEVKCFICDTVIHESDDVSTLTEKGVIGVQRTCKERKISEFQVSVGQRVHKKCRARFLNLKSPFHKTDLPCGDSRILRSSQSSFEYRKDCFFCGVEITLYYRQRKVDACYQVRTANLQSSILSKCDERGDEWAERVKRRIIGVSDLHAVDACYHKQCMVNFRNGKETPSQFSSITPGTSGRPEDKVRQTAFLQVAKYIEENDEEQTTIVDLVNKMKEYMPQDSICEPYSAKFMKKKITSHFAEAIIVDTIGGTADVVTFKTTAASILKDYHSNSYENVDEDKRSLILAAAEIIRNEIKDITIEPDTYTTIEDIGNVERNVNYLPESLKILMTSLVTGKNNERKVAAIGQAIMQAVRPRVLVAPLQLGLGVQLHNNTNSRFLVDSVNHMGFSCSYSEVQRFQRSAAASTGTSIPEYFPGSFVQYVADNIDHNINTIDGHGTFHGMGIIATVTPAVKTDSVIRKQNVTFEELKELGKISLKVYPSQASGLRLLKYSSIKEIQYNDASASLDILWNISHLLRPSVPGWQGLCQQIYKGEHPGIATVLFLPMINMDPTNETCILSTLFFVTDHAKRYGHTPVLTFDQPLFSKALGIITNEPANSPLKEIVLRLGGLHTIMSFLGCIGFLMTGSGLHDILEIIYAGNAVKHMLSGKAIARAIRGHLILYSALSTILAKDVLCTGEEAASIDLTAASSLLDKLLNGETTLDGLLSAVMEPIVSKLASSKKILHSYRTPRLWLQYMHMVDILRNFIKAERTGNWQLHLACVKDMLPFFAASGHNLYVSSARLYLQAMTELESTAPEIYSAFSNGLHVVRRSDRYWGGLSTDLVIEQVLMKNIKGCGGLTHGRGMTENQQLLWTMSRPLCAQMNNSMQEFSGVKHIGSEQHITMTTARITRDNADINKVLEFIEQLNIFQKDNSLRSVVSGVTHGNEINPDIAEEIGQNILDEMTDKMVTEFTFKRSKQVKPMKTVHVVQGKNNSFVIEPEVLFQRLLLCAQTNALNLHELFSYELCTYPASLFDKQGLMRESSKSQLASYIRDIAVIEEGVLMPGTVHYIIDGGFLLHRLPWSQKETFEDIFTAYVKYVQNKYGKATIVFDGYGEELCTKAEAHKRRTKGVIGPKVNFLPSTTAALKKDLFLANTENKQMFINELSEKLQVAGCITKHAIGDADVLIVQEGIISAENCATAIVGEDTDLLILLLHHVNMECCDIFLCPEPKKSSTRVTVYNIKSLRQKLGSDVCSNILFAHALLGCDTTSKLFSIGKSETIKLLKKSETFRAQAAIFKAPGRFRSAIEDAGHDCVVQLYRGCTGESLNQIRLRTFTEKASKSMLQVKPEVLPPTQDACHFHSLRVYHQVQQWMGNNMNPCNWGWEILHGGLQPVKMSQAPAPEHLLKYVKCSCSKSQCSTLQCSCKKQGMLCTSACTDCRGVSCCNSVDIDMEDD